MAGRDPGVEDSAMLYIKVHHNRRVLWRALTTGASGTCKERRMSRRSYQSRKVINHQPSKHLMTSVASNRERRVLKLTRTAGRFSRQELCPAPHSI